MTQIDLFEFLQERMTMVDVYQPVIIKELLLHDGVRTKAELAFVLKAYDLSVQKYYERILMRWPKDVLTTHGIVDYERRGSLFHLRSCPDSVEKRLELIQLCDKKIEVWLKKNKTRNPTTSVKSSIRYEVLKEAGGKCQLCGIPSSIKPIDIDHIVPRSKADKDGKVRRQGRLIDLHSHENLQALCISCNRAKRASDQTDFRIRTKLVRDRIPELIEAEGREPVIKKLQGHKLRAALLEKLAEEHAELLGAKKTDEKIEELADMIEVILALAAQLDTTETKLMEVVKRKRAKKGGFEKGIYYHGDV